MPNLQYDNETNHPSEILFHIQALDSSEDSFKFVFSESVIRYPVMAGADEQEMNQGTFIENNELCGLKEKMTPADIRRRGLQNLGHTFPQKIHLLSQ